MRPRPLLGTVIGVTADRRSDEQALLLEGTGATVMHGPTIRTLPLADHERLAGKIRELRCRPPAVVLLTTGIGARGWFSAAAAAGLDGQLRQILEAADVLARGPKAAGTAVSYGLEPRCGPDHERSSEIIEILRECYPRGVRVAVQLDGSGDMPVVDGLRAIGADVVAVRVYRWTQPVLAEPARRLIEAIADRRLDAVTFTSSPALRNLLVLAERLGTSDEVRTALGTDVTTVCVGPVCAATARSLGIEPAVVPVRARLGVMVEALTQHLGEPASLQLGNERLVLRRSAVVTADRVVDLSPRERAVLGVLATKPGAVVSRDTLGRAAWPDGRADDHAVGVTVARLRRRLGRLGDAVETLPRRGYRLAAERAG